ncbi:hypothetical protein ACFL6I_08610 [candidate division KSB1 bacterium]
MKEVDIIYNITLVVFSISFAWMVSERINYFPKIRRFYALFGIFRLCRKAGLDESQRKRIISDFFVLVSSWFIIFVSLSVSIEALSYYYGSFCSMSLYHKMTNRYLIPFLFLVAPQFISRLISSVVLWLSKHEIRFLWENDNHVFDNYSSGWKDAHCLTQEGITSGEVYKKGRNRSFSSFGYLIVIYTLIFSLNFIYSILRHIT